MTRADVFSALADVALITHVAFIAFVVVGLLVILLGGMRGWNWVRNPWFRLLHLASIGLVVVQAWLGIICPLTTLEMALREKAGDSTYGGTFVAHWLQRLIYYEAPPWVFAVSYTVFGLAVVGSWLKFRPRRFSERP
jgi:Na+(H+)/acetate symporter ActP